MDASRFDALARALVTAGSRRGLLSILTALPLLGGLAALLDPDDSAADGRRKRRKKRHKHGKGRRRKHHTRCQANSRARTCAGKCGSVKNTCKKTVDCGSCACDPPCAVCFICEDGPNTPGECVIDPAQQGDACGEPGQVCQSDGTCACDASSCSNPTPLCVSGACVACSTDTACQAAALGDLCCGGACVSGDCCDSTSCSNPTPACVSHTCTACTSSNQCPATTICDGGSCQACDVCATCTYTTVQAAVADGSGPTTIRICPGTYGKITVTRSLTLIGAGEGANAASNTILDAQQTGNTVFVSNAGTVTLRRLRITGGNGGNGAGVRNSTSTLTLTNCTVTGNANTDSQGGGVHTNLPSTLTMVDCTISDNHANGTFPASGGGVSVSGPATLTNCTISGNSASTLGGGISVNDASLTLNGGTVTGNEAGNNGGGILNNVGVVTLTNGASVTGNFAPPGTPNNCAGTAIVGCVG